MLSFRLCNLYSVCSPVVYRSRSIMCTTRAVNDMDCKQTRQLSAISWGYWVSIYYTTLDYWNTSSSPNPPKLPPPPPPPPRPPLFSSGDFSASAFPPDLCCRCQPRPTPTERGTTRQTAPRIRNLRPSRKHSSRGHDPRQVIPFWKPHGVMRSHGGGHAQHSFQTEGDSFDGCRDFWIFRTESLV